MGTFFPLACMVSGEQLGEKQKLRKAAGTILLPQHGNNHGHDMDGKEWGFRLPSIPCQPRRFCGGFQKRD